VDAPISGIAELRSVAVAAIADDGDATAVASIVTGRADRLAATLFRFGETTIFAVRLPTLESALALAALLAARAKLLLLVVCGRRAEANARQTKA
jgi:hypothetical protein